MTDLELANDALRNALGDRNDEIHRLRDLVQTLLDNDPDDMAADGVTVLMVWRIEARAALGGPVLGGWQGGA